MPALIPCVLLLCSHCTGRCCIRHPRSCTDGKVRADNLLIFASKHPERGAALVRGTQIAEYMQGAVLLGGPRVHKACQIMGHANKVSCARHSRRMVVVHLKDLSTALFTSLPYAVHLLDPIDKVYRGWSTPNDMRLCGLLTHSDAQAELYRAHGVTTSWTVPDHGLPACEAHGGQGSAAPLTAEAQRRVFDRRTVVVLGGTPSPVLRATLGDWAGRAGARLLYEKDLRSSIAFSLSEGWSAWLCTLLRQNASIAVAWDQVTGLEFESDCTRHMGLTGGECFALKPAERFIVPLSAGLPAIGYRYPSFREAARSRRSPERSARRASDLLLAGSLAGLVTRLDALTSNFSHWQRARGFADAVGASHSMRAIAASYRRVRQSALAVKAPSERCSERGEAAHSARRAPPDNIPRPAIG